MWSSRPTHKKSQQTRNPDMNTEYLPIQKPEDLTEAILEQAYLICDGWYAEEPIQWGDFLDRLETWAKVDLGSDMDSPAIKDLKCKVRQHKKQAQ